MKPVAILLYAAILLAATLLLDSRLLWLLYGPLSIALLDACCFRIFVKPDPIRSRFFGLIGPMLAALVATAGGGVLRKVFKIPVPYEEIARVAVTAALLWFLFETLCALFVRWLRTGPERHWRNTARRSGAAFAAVGPPAFFLLPLINLHPPHVAPVDLRNHFPATFEDVSFTAADGVQLSGWWAEGDAQRGNVLLCHGHGQTRSQLAEVLSYLQQRGYNVLAFDFRGHGASAGLSCCFGAREVADVKAAAAFAKERGPNLPLYVVGFSYGAIVSLQALPELENVAACWVDSPCGHFAAIAQRYFDFLPGRLRDWAVAGYDEIVWCDCGFRLTAINPADALAKVHVPLHVSHCTGDPLIPYADCRKMYDDYAGPKECHFPDVNCHGAFSNVAPDLYLEKLGAFFAAH